MNLILFGPPGAGKGTQSDKLIVKYNLIHLSTGDLFRLHLKNSTALGIEAKKYMDEGNLVPDSVVINMVKDKIEENLNSNGFIFCNIDSIFLTAFNCLLTIQPLFNNLKWCA